MEPRRNYCLNYRSIDQFIFVVKTKLYDATGTEKSIHLNFHFHALLMPVPFQLDPLGKLDLLSQSSFPVKNKVDNVDIFALLKLETKLDGETNYLNFNS